MANKKIDMKKLGKIAIDCNEKVIDAIENDKLSESDILGLYEIYKGDIVEMIRKKNDDFKKTFMEV